MPSPLKKKASAPALPENGMNFRSVRRIRVRWIEKGELYTYVSVSESLKVLGGGKTLSFTLLENLDAFEIPALLTQDDRTFLLKYDDEDAKAVTLRLVEYRRGEDALLVCDSANHVIYMHIE